MSVLRYFSIPRAYRDIRRFLVTRRPYELWFLLLAMVLTMLILVGFLIDSNIEVPYKENIVYMQSWPADRSEAEILAQQKIDAAKKAERDAEIKRLTDERQAEFKRLDNELDAWGL